MKAGKVWWWAVAIALAGAGVAYFALRDGQVVPPPAEPAVELQPSLPLSQGEPGTVPPIRYPIEAVEPAAAEAPPAPALPALDESDAVLAASLGQTAGSDLLVLRNLIRRVVATVDNLPRERVALRLSPLKPADGGLLVAGSGDDRVISEHNRGRYAPYVIFAETVDTGYLVALYTRFYPLFQQAYQELGYPDGYFNDRLVAVIDHLIAAPVHEGPIRVVQPKVLYEFADPALEGLSAGQKLMVRMGPDNATRIKAKLREVRQRVAGGVPAD